MSKILINGNWIASTQDPFTFVSKIRQIRREGLINQYISVRHVIRKKEILIFSDRGRLMRPLLVVRDHCILLAPGDITPDSTL